MLATPTSEEGAGKNSSLLFAEQKLLARPTSHQASHARERILINSCYSALFLTAQRKYKGA
eukprot:1161646-Pelagomonas_calceolata.AAC.17